MQGHRDRKNQPEEIKTAIPLSLNTVIFFVHADDIFHRLHLPFHVPWWPKPSIPKCVARCRSADGAGERRVVAW
jgi:hypothetical protein